jgi:hypothetical protein
MKTTTSQFRKMFLICLLTLTALAIISWIVYHKGVFHPKGVKPGELDGQTLAGFLALIVGGAAGIASAFAVVTLSYDANAIQQKAFELESNGQKKSEFMQVLNPVQSFIRAADELDDLCKYLVSNPDIFDIGAAKARAISKFTELNSILREIHLLPDELLPRSGQTFAFYQQAVLTKIDPKTKVSFFSQDDIEKFRTMRLDLLLALELKNEPTETAARTNLLRWTLYATCFSCVARRAIYNFITELKSEKLIKQSLESDVVFISVRQTIDGILNHLPVDSDHYQIVTKGLKHLDDTSFHGPSFDFLYKLIDVL